MEDIELDFISVVAQVWEMQALVFSTTLLLGLLRLSREQNIYELIRRFFTPKPIDKQTDLWLRNATMTISLGTVQIHHSDISPHIAFAPQNKSTVSALCLKDKLYENSNLRI
ncbi:hypothetical protein ACX64L_03715 [Pseudomonas monsensis]